MSTNILAKIVASKFGEVAERKKQISIAQLEAMPLFEQKGYSLKANLLDKTKTGIVAEFKRQSPSKGIINAIANVVPPHKTIQRLDAVMKARKALGFNAAPLLTIEALMCELV